MEFAAETMEANGDEYLQHFVYLKCREQESLFTLLNVDNIFFFCSGCQPLLFLHHYLPLWRSGNLCSSGASLPNAGDLVSVLTPEGLCAARDQDSLRVSWGNVCLGSAVLSKAWGGEMTQGQLISYGWEVKLFCIPHLSASCLSAK